MEPFEEKLKEYFDQVQPDGEFMDRLKALEGSPEAKPLPRGKPRRWVTPVAAGVAAALALGTGWAYLRGTLPGNAPEPTPAYSAPAAEASAEIPEEPGPELPPDPAPSVETPEEPAPEAPAQAAPQPPAQKTPAPRPEQPEAPAAVPAPADPPETPPEADPPPMDPPPEPGSLPEDEPAHAEPENDPPRKPEEKPDPPEETPPADPEIVPVILAQYQTAGSRETLTLSSVLTGQTAVIDVTGQLPPPKEPSQPGNPGEEAASAASESGEPSIYTGYCTAFGWQIRYTLVRDGADSIFAVAVAETPESERSLS